MKQSAADKAFIAKLKTLTVGVGAKPSSVLHGKKLQKWAKDNNVPTQVEFECGSTAELIAVTDVDVKLNVRPKHDGSGEVQVVE